MKPTPTQTQGHAGRRLGLLLPVALLLQACASTAPPADPAGAAARAKVQMPAGWRVDAPAAESPLIDGGWWTAFQSPALERLITEAQGDSAELRIAYERIRQAEITLRQSGASRWPSVNASAGASRSRSSTAGVETTRESTNLGVSASYEVDLWGRVADSVRAGNASLRASQHDWQAARLSLLAGVAGQYFQWLGLSERVALAQANLARTERLLTIVESRLRNGVATPLEVSQQRSTLLSQRVSLLALQQQRSQSATALALLLGRQPIGFSPEAYLSASGDATAVASNDFAALRVPELAPGLPAALLTRRPDLAAAEAQLAAADANVDAARAALLPTASLSASSTMTSASLFSLADPTRGISLGLSLAQSLFDGGRQRAQVQLSESQRLVLIENYGQAVRTAVKEVGDALGQAGYSQQQEDLQRELVAQAQASLRLAELRYREGSGDLMSLLDAQRSLFSAQDNLSVQRLARLQAVLDLYKALGGDWAAPPKV
ncbi:efflux transporter outer membrane subunit [Hylemonella gracilis]|uniref:Putative outer membrane efflux protein n=1 Tax=Hylemonella gracilis ATCC 19624 TaxID=887062 RepID=F3KSL5_9BURK|nr:efflux transporter outer membrane subunit [Hylemonella gracilis]EGI77084.1 putative outer membrane efflux protein [Hylemonella gracilis ATCC 19624]